MSLKTVLVVDDDEALRLVLSEALRAEGIKTLEAQNGVDGLTIALEKHPDFILLDILMPEMGGEEMLQKLRADEWGKNASVFVLTQLDSMDKISDMMTSKIDGYFVKSSLSVESMVKDVKKKLGM
ncbi:response regulator [Patescibacteria group bacterium]|nr:response regulator [Patescibacteria group bacterium]